MAETIDNVKVGEKIKQLLKEHKMTQDDLAQKLSISKSAVSQNLRGKSTFDIQNLISIAKIFNITLDELLNLNQDASNQWFSEYQKVVTKGLIAINDVPAENLTIKTPDLYGRVLVDYVVEANAIEMFQYIHKHNVEMVDLYYHRAKEIFLKIIKYGLENNINDMYKYIVLYSQIHGGFKIEDETIESIIWGLIDKNKSEDIIKQLSNNKSNQIRFTFKKSTVQRPLSKNDLIRLIAKHKLNHVLTIWFIYGANLDDFKEVVDIFLEYDYEQGMIDFIEHFVTKPLTWIKKIALDVQKLYLKVVEKNSLKLIKMFAEKKLYIDLTEITKKLITLNQLTNANELIIHYPDQLNFSELGLMALNAGHIDFVSRFLHKLSKEDLSYLFSVVKIDKTDALIYLLKHGALVEERFYNYKTFEKVNLILGKFIDKGEQS